MSSMRFNFRSQVLGCYVDVSIVFPTDQLSYYRMEDGFRHHVGPGEQKVLPCYAQNMKFQTVYLMHGGGDDDSLPYRYTSAERYAQQNCVMLVTPNIANSFGVDTGSGVKYATFVGEELPTVVQALFASSPAREDNFIVGYAMGGNVALGQAIMHPERFAACVDISGGIGMTLDTQKLIDELQSPHFKDFPIYHAAFGPADQIRGSRYDIHQICVQNLVAGKAMPVFHLMAGTEEGAIRARVMEDARMLKELGIDVQYMDVEGGRHDFALWDSALKLVFDELLPLRRKPLYT